MSLALLILCFATLTLTPDQIAANRVATATGLARAPVSIYSSYQKVMNGQTWDGSMGIAAGTAGLMNGVATLGTQVYAASSPDGAFRSSLSPAAASFLANQAPAGGGVSEFRQFSSAMGGVGAGVGLLNGAKQVYDGNYLGGAANLVASGVAGAKVAVGALPSVAKAANDAGVASVLNNPATNFVAALPAAASFGKDLYAVEQATSPEQKKVAAMKAQVSGANLGQAGATIGLSTYGGPLGAVVAGGVGAGEFLYNNLINQGKAPSTIGSAVGKFSAITTHNGGDVLKTTGQLMDTMSRDKRADASSSGFSGFINHYGGVAARGIGETGLTIENGLTQLWNGVTGDDRKSWTEQQVAGTLHREVKKEVPWYVSSPPPPRIPSSASTSSNGPVLQDSSAKQRAAAKSYYGARTSSKWGSCQAKGLVGICEEVSVCGGTAIPGHCPGPVNIQCCVSTH